jgi:hypothetical protein
VRYQFGTPIYTQANNLANFDPSLYNPAQAVTVLANGTTNFWGLSAKRVRFDGRRENSSDATNDECSKSLALEDCKWRRSHMIEGYGYEDRFLSEDEIRALSSETLDRAHLDGKRVLIIIPDRTRTAPIPQMFRLFHELLGERVAALDYLIALGTHKLLSEESINKHVGVTQEEREGKYANVQIFNHRWDQPETFVSVGQDRRGRD